MYSDVLHYGMYTLEHVLPQKWQSNNDWLSTPSYDENNELIDNTDIEGFVKNRNLAVKSLGNFALLTSKLNTSVSNGNFKTKIEGTGRRGQEGMRKFAANLETTNDIIRVYDNQEEWDERKIYENESSYYEMLNNIYNFN